MTLGVCGAYVIMISNVSSLIDAIEDERDYYISVIIGSLSYNHMGVDVDCVWHRHTFVMVSE